MTLFNKYLDKSAFLVMVVTGCQGIRNIDLTLTTLIAAELTGAIFGLRNMLQEAYLDFSHPEIFQRADPHPGIPG